MLKVSKTSEAVSTKLVTIVKPVPIASPTLLPLLTALSLSAFDLNGIFQSLIFSALAACLTIVPTESTALAIADVNFAAFDAPFVVKSITVSRLILFQSVA